MKIIDVYIVCYIGWQYYYSFKMKWIYFCVTFKLMKWPRLQEADFSQYEKQIEVVVKGGGGHQIFKWDYSYDQVMHIDKM